MSEDNRNQSNTGDKHEYDGIVELDNQLPRWWRNLFYATIIFSIIYVWHYEFGVGPSIQDEFNAQMNALELQRLAKSSGAGLSEEKLLAVIADAQEKSKGKAIFDFRCASCHGLQGGGGIGPNLVDKFWMNGNGKPISVAQLIKDGVPAKGMPPWGAILSESELYAVTAYVHSMKGSNPVNAKEPQGNEYP